MIRISLILSAIAFSLASLAAPHPGPRPSVHRPPTPRPAVRYQIHAPSHRPLSVHHIPPRPAPFHSPLLAPLPRVLFPPPLFHYVTQSVYIPGRYVFQLQPDGTSILVWQPAHYESRQVLVPTSILP